MSAVSRNLQQRYFNVAIWNACIKYKRSLSTSSTWAEKSCLHGIERAIDKVDATWRLADINNIDPAHRETVSVARLLRKKLQKMRMHNTCPHCWFPRQHCACCPPLGNCPFKRIYVLMHFREVGQRVDTSKVLWMAFNNNDQPCKLVVGGIGPEYQDAMQEMMQSLETETTWVLFPSEHAKVWSDWCMDVPHLRSTNDNEPNTLLPRNDNLIILDGTWSQAQHLYTKYLVDYVENDARTNVRAVQLSPTSLQHVGDTTINNLYNGRQLRKHPVAWREIGTLEAARLLFTDVTEQQQDKYAHMWSKLAEYQTRINNRVLELRSVALDATSSSSVKLQKNGCLPSGQEV